MNYYQSGFKNSILNTIFVLSKKIWLNITYGYLVYTLSFFTLGGIITGIALLGVSDLSFFKDMLDKPSPDESLLILDQLYSMFLTPEFMIYFSILMIVVLVLVSWNYYFSFRTVDSEIKHEEFSFGILFKQSLGLGIFKLMGITILLNIIIYALFFLAIMSVNFSGIMAFFLFIFAVILSLRFILIIPAYLIGNYDLKSSFAFSFHHITWLRSLKLLCVGLLGILALLGVSLLVGLISGILSFIPYLGVVIRMIINVIFGSFMMAFTVSSLVGLYYRYADNLPSTDSESPDLLNELTEE